MKRKKGSSLIISVFCFSLLSIIAITLLALSTSNYNIIANQQNYIENFYICDGAIEIIKGEITHNVDEYFRGNNKKMFIQNIESVKNDDLKIDIISDDIGIENDIISFEVSIYRKTKDIEKQINVKFNVDLSKDDDDEDLIKISDYLENK